MFSLVNGKPVFYKGKINGIGYINEDEKELIINYLKEDNPDIEIKEEEVTIDNDYKKRVLELGEKNLTFSKSEFLKLLNGEIPLIEDKLNDMKRELEINQALNMMEIAKSIEKLKGGN